MLSGQYLSSYGLLLNLNASVTRICTGTRMRMRTWTTEVSRIALCTSCRRTENKKSFGSVFHFSGKPLYIHGDPTVNRDY